MNVNRIKSIGKWFLVVLVVALLAVQVVPVKRTNPAIEAEVPVPVEVRTVLRRACYDCHSNETVWPWYSRVAPVSWLVAYDVNHGREELNFSTWNRQTTAQQTKAIQKCWEEVEGEEMPPEIYVELHPDARLSEKDRSVLREWSVSAGVAGP